MTSKKPERPHPLDMPEIITLIGYCLPRWKYNDRLGFHDFTPKFLLRCTLVNKTWRDALLPVIWSLLMSTFEGLVDFMVGSDSARRVDGEQCGVTREFDLEGAKIRTFFFIDIFITDGHDRTRAWMVDEDEWNLGRFTVIALEAICLGHSHSHSQSHTSALQELRLDISQPKENAFVDLIQSSPNLTTFSLLTESASDPRSLMPLIRLFCPKLRSIELMLRFSSSLQGFDYLTETEYADLILAAPPHQLETLKVDIPWLDDGMTQAIIQHQAMSLTSLHLKFKARRSMDPMKDPENIVKILKWCTRLRHVSISFNPHGLGREETIRLVDQPWGCLDLETLELIDVTMTDSMVLGHAQALNDLQQHQHQQQQSYQWHLASTTDSDNNYNQGGGPVMAGGGGFGIGGVAVSSATHPGGGSGGARESRHGMSAKQMLFEQVRRLPRLTKLSLNHVTYSINGQS
ncbi:hypothetical protein EDD11_000673 [Mortierella claussenii]|nr:hypothetical protein EDD11_000659 [Mortierella claussenii]KAI1315545.1 hypothetical protein EDD11_000673 [Mortierella claussenii]